MGLNEVLNNLKGWGAWDFRAYHLEENEAQIVIKALEKQKPQGLEAVQMGCMTVSGNCPGCKNRIISAKGNDPDELVTNYCRYCGQKITWEGKAADNED